MQKKKILFFFSSILIFIFIFIIFYPKIDIKKIFKRNILSNNKKIRIATALNNTRLFLEGDFKNDLKKKNIDLEVIFLDNQYKLTNDLLLQDQVLATFDSHLPYVKNKLRAENKLDQNIVIAHPFYLSKIGFYSDLSRMNNNSNTQNIENIKEGIKKGYKYKIILPFSVEQKSLFLLFLQQMDLIRLKLNISSKEKEFDESDFDIPEQIELIKSLNMISLYHEFKNDKSIHFLMNYPGILGKEKDNLILIKSLEIPLNDVKNPIYDYTISLIVKEKNVNSEDVKILKETLSQQKFIDSMNKSFGLYLEMISLDKMNEIIINVNNKYNY
ncbi:hypothetical protein [Candidatus Phytoplasma oryzae]|nr:hypothetical protein PIE28_00885 [Candidatus Phytoplasma oryzae]